MFGQRDKKQKKDKTRLASEVTPESAGKDSLTPQNVRNILHELLAELGLDNLPNDLSNVEKKLQQKVDDIIEGLNFENEEFKRVKEKVDKNEAELKKVNKELDTVKAQLAAEKEARLRNECHQRRSNLKFFNIPEDDNETDIQTQRKFLKLAEEKFGCETGTFYDLPIERVHRMGPKPTDISKQRPRPIIVKFSFFRDREYIWHNKKMLAGTNIYVREDFPPEIDRRVNIMMPIFLAARRDKNVKVSLVIDKLYLNNSKFTVETIDRLPEHLRPESLAMKETDDKVFFFKKDCFLSNHYSCKVEGDDGTIYNCSEQLFKADKAKTFKDDDALKLIMESDNPGFQKSVRVKNYKHQVWMQKAKDVMRDAVNRKFSQNPELKQKLLNTGTKVLCEANPRDNIWGAGLGMHDSRILDSGNWGQNELGKILMEVRQQLKDK